MSSEQAARKRRASERAQRTRRSAPAALCSFAGTGASPAPREAGMRAAANASSRRQHGGKDRGNGTEAAAMRTVASRLLLAAFWCLLGGRCMPGSARTIAGLER
jgi:hypothetical protein